MGYLSEHNWTVSAEEKERCIQLAEYLVEHRSTVRATACYFGISKSTVHKDLSEKLWHVHPALYESAKQIMEQNKAERHIRGGKATQNKYRQLREKQDKNDRSHKKGNLSKENT